jgi:hypothetical protein
MFDKDATKELAKELGRLYSEHCMEDFPEQVANLTEDEKYQNADWNDAGVKPYADIACNIVKSLITPLNTIQKHYAKFNRKNKSYSFCVF